MLGKYWWSSIQSWHTIFASWGCCKDIFMCRCISMQLLHCHCSAALLFKCKLHQLALEVCFAKRLAHPILLDFCLSWTVASQKHFISYFLLLKITRHLWKGRRVIVNWFCFLSFFASYRKKIIHTFWLPNNQMNLKQHQNK